MRWKDCVVDSFKARVSGMSFRADLQTEIRQRMKRGLVGGKGGSVRESDGNAEHHYTNI